MRHTTNEMNGDDPKYAARAQDIKTKLQTINQPLLLIIGDVLEGMKRVVESKTRPVRSIVETMNIEIIIQTKGFNNCGDPACKECQP